MIAYVLEQAVVSIIDILVCGLAAFWIVRGRRMRTWGVVLAILYVLALVGMYMGGTLGLGPVFGILGAVIGAVLGVRANRGQRATARPTA